MRLSDWLTWGPIIFNGVLAGVNAYEGNIGKFLYWLGAFILTIGIYKMEG